MKKHILRKPTFWPDMYEQNEKFYKADNDRFTVMAILITIILILVLVICCQCTKLYEISTRDVEAAEIITDNRLAIQLAFADKVDRIIAPAPTEAVQGILALPSADGRFKTYMDYRTITRRDSAQYQLQQLAWTDEDGFRRYEQYYLVALGTAFGKTIGQTFEITLSDGRVFDAMLADVKADEHTDSSHRYIESNGNIVEFIIDRNKMNKDVLAGGDVSPLGFTGAVQEIRKVEFK